MHRTNQRGLQELAGPVVQGGRRCLGKQKWDWKGLQDAWLSQLVVRSQQCGYVGVLLGVGFGMFSKAVCHDVAVA